MIHASITGKRIAELRKEKGLTQKELAEKIHVTDKAISKWERGINFPELTIMENLAEELETTVVDLLDLENATGREVVEEVTKLSAAEKQEVLNKLRIHSYLKLVIEIVLFFALIETSKILNENGIHGKGQMLTMGLLGVVGALMGMEIYAMKKLRSGIKSEVLALKWKGLAIQILCCRIFGWRILKTLPLFFSLLLALWGSWLYLTSESWMNAKFSDLLCGYIRVCEEKSVNIDLL